MDLSSYEFPPEAQDHLTTDEFWVRNVPPADSDYWRIVHIAADVLKADGCTGVADIYRESCLEHDVHWRTGRTVFGVRITTKQADERFRRVIQSRSRLGVWSPVSWIRWVGVRIGSRFITKQSA